MDSPTPMASFSPVTQPSLPGMCPIQAALRELAHAGIEERGAIFTRREVVEFILDLAGYTPDKPLHSLRLLEPSFGNGDFLIPVVERLLEGCRIHGFGDDISCLHNTICAVELHRESFDNVRTTLVSLLAKHFSKKNAEALAKTWLIQGDFLLTPLHGGFTHVVGNPPYVRQELIPDVLIAEYRQRFHTIYDRADIYIPFIEKSLSLLAESGQLAFICADRWMKNRYGGPLRRMIAENFHLRVYVDMVDTQAFHKEVIAYPAITLIAREKPGPTRVAHQPLIDRIVLSNLVEQLLGGETPATGTPVRDLSSIVAGAEPWILESSDQLALVRRLERQFPAIEDAGCSVGIGVATGADKAFIGPYDELDVEEDRKLPLVMTRDILTGEINWRGLGVINPFLDNGHLVNLAAYPRLERYLTARRDIIAARHIARKSPSGWYRTIDRIYPTVARRPKLLIPDIKGQALVAYEDGKLYPHHNLYFITSDEWNLKALQAVLMSGIARLFVAIYSTRMHGGFLRFQAQYLRRIRIPRWKDVPNELKTRLQTAAEQGDKAACNRVVFTLYGLSPEERAALGGNGD